METCQPTSQPVGGDGLSNHEEPAAEGLWRRAVIGYAAVEPAGVPLPSGSVAAISDSKLTRLVRDMHY